jgi:hypothetical protein
MEDEVARFIIILILLAVLVVGGGLTLQLVSEGGDVASLLPYLQQTEDPAASPLYAESWQAEQFFLMVGFILFNLIGIGVTIALIMWLLDRGVRISRAAETEQSDNQQQGQTS